MVFFPYIVCPQENASSIFMSGTRLAKHNHDDGTAEISTMLISRQIWIHIQIHNNLSRVISMMALIWSKTGVMKLCRPSTKMM